MKLSPGKLIEIVVAKTWKPSFGLTVMFKFANVGNSMTMINVFVRQILEFYQILWVKS